MNYQQKKQAWFKGLQVEDKDTANFIKSLAGKHTIDSIEYTKENQGIRFDNKKQTMTEINT